MTDRKEGLSQQTMGEGEFPRDTAKEKHPPFIRKWEKLLENKDEIINVMRVELEKYSREGGWSDYCKVVEELLILFPERRSDLNLNAEFLPEIMNRVHKIKRTEGTIDLVVRVKSLFPEEFSKLGLDLGGLWEAGRARVISWLETGNLQSDDILSGSLTSFLAEALNLRRLFPERFGEVNIPDEVPRKVEDELSTRESFDMIAVEKFVSMATTAKLLFSERITIPNRDGRFWGRVKDKMNKERDGLGTPRRSFLWWASRLKILSYPAQINSKGEIMISEGIKL